MDELLRTTTSRRNQHYTLFSDFVVVVNVDRLVYTGDKKEQKRYYRHSGYMGGLKITLLKDLIKKNPLEPLRRAVFGMIPKNKLRLQRMRARAVGFCLASASPVLPRYRPARGRAAARRARQDTFHKTREAHARLHKERSPALAPGP